MQPTAQLEERNKEPVFPLCILAKGLILKYMFPWKSKSQPLPVVHDSLHDLLARMKPERGDWKSWAYTKFATLRGHEPADPTPVGENYDSEAGTTDFSQDMTTVLTSLGRRHSLYVSLQTPDHRNDHVVHAGATVRKSDGQSGRLNIILCQGTPGGKREKSHILSDLLRKLQEYDSRERREHEVSASSLVRSERAIARE
jgi:hypothetical protein